MQAEQFQLHAALEERHWWFLARRRIVGRLLGRLLAEQNAPLVLDVGCGTGGNVCELSRQFRCVGVDTSPEAIQFAQTRFPGIEFRRGFAPEAVADVAPEASAWLLMDVLEHVPDDFSLFSSLLAASRPGAIFVVTVPADQALWSEHDVSFGHYRRYDRNRFRRLWQGLPVREHLVSHFNSRLYPAIRMVRAWSRLRGIASGTAGTDFRLPSRPINRVLRTVFEGESRRLEALLDQPDRWAYPRGVSLVAVLSREAGNVSVRSRPGDVCADDVCGA